jgi:hypothetical protein
MHKGRITVAIIAGVGLLTLFFPWIEITDFSVDRGIVLNKTTEVYYGFQTWYGQLAGLLFAVIGILALVGKTDVMISKGFPKITILGACAVLLLEAITIFAICGFTKNYTVQAGVYGIIIVSLIAAIAPYLFKADGTVHLPKVKNVLDDIEESAEIVEDKIEDITEKIEDKFDGDDDDDKDEMKTAAQKAKPSDSSEKTS